MQIYLISDNVDTATGMRLAGIPGTVAHTEEEVSDAVSKVICDENIGVLLVTNALKKEFEHIFSEISLRRRLPLVVEVPDRHGYDTEKSSITGYIETAIGLKL